MATRSLSVGVVAFTLVVACNEAPVGGAVNIAPLHPVTTDDLLARIGEDAVDPNRKDSVTYRMSWTLDGAAVPDLDGASVVPAERTAKGQVWEVTLLPSDGTADGTPTTAKVTIGNARPVVTDVTIEPTTAYLGTVFTAVATAEDPDGDPVTLSYVWYVDGVRLDVTGPTLETAFATRRRDVVVAAVANDGELNSEPLRSDGVVVLNRAPEIGLVTLAPEAPTVLSTAVCSAHDLEDGDGDVVRLRYVWHVDGVEVVGAEASRMALRPFRKEQEVSCTVTPYDGFDDGQSMQSPEVLIVNSPPSAPQIAIDPEAPYYDQDLRCAVLGESVDADGDPLTYTFTWTRNGEEWTGTVGDGAHLGDTIWAELTEPGDTWSCAASVTDGEATVWSAPAKSVDIISEEVYYVTLADLVNQPYTCDSFGGIHRYAGGGMLYGFKWSDRRDTVPRSITVAYNHALNCGVGTRTGYVNGVAVGTVHTGDVSNCICNVTAGMWAKEYTFSDIGAIYKPGAENTFTMNAVSSEGMSPRPEWDNYYAIVTVTY